MVKLRCAVVRVAACAFGPKLRLFLSKKEDGSWLRSNDPFVRQMQEGEVPDELKSLYMKQELDDPTDEIRTILPSEIPGGSIHVLVVVRTEDVGVRTSASVDSLTGPEVDLSSGDDLLAFLESDMTDKEATVSRPHIWTDESLQFRLIGWEQAIDAASKCFSNIINHTNIPALDRTKVVIPVCSGISGLGKHECWKKA
ncbi:hypothetical protein PF008_g29653, partial [Phytophthora fragariae]